MPALTDVESKLFSTKDFRLENGETLPVLELAYETYGSLNAKADNAVLVVHGYTSSHHAAGKADVGEVLPIGVEIRVRQVGMARKRKLLSGGRKRGLVR